MLFIGSKCPKVTFGLKKEPWGQMGSKGFVSSFEQFLVVLDHWPVFWYHHPDRHLDIEAEILVEIVVECWQPSK